MAATDGRPIPKKNTAYRLTFNVLDADGDPVGGITFDTGLASGANKALVSIDGGAGANSSASISTQITNMDGCYFLDLTSGEMNCDTIIVYPKITGPAGAKSPVIILNPQEAGDIQVQVNSLDNNVITSAVLATDCIGSSQLAASAVTEIQTGLATSAAVTNIQADTDDIQSRLPAALVSGRMDSSVGAMATDVITNSALNANAATEIAQAVWDFLTASAVTAGSFGVQLKTNLDATISSRPAGSDYSPSRAAKLDNLDTTVSSRASPSDVLTQAAASFATATVPALTVGAPAATPTIAQALSLVYMMYRNRQVVTTTEVKLYADDGTTVITKWPHSEAASTYDRSEAVTGP